VHFALVAYRDHPPQDVSYVTQVHTFTDNLAVMKSYVDTMFASGGGDGPESVTDGLYEVLHLPYRKDSTRICIFIADAPPHGIGSHDDGFPDGCPLGHDPLLIARDMASQGILVYSVCCEPQIKSYRGAVDFMKAISDITLGQAISLNSANFLANIITGGAQEEISLADLQGDVETALSSLPTGMSDEDIISSITKKLKDQGVTTVQLNVKTITNTEAPLTEIFITSSNLKEARRRIESGEVPTLQKKESETVTIPSGTTTYNLITEAQVKRLYLKIKNKI